MSAFGALFWTFLVTFIFLWVFSMAVAIRPGAKDDELVAGAAQVIGYSLGLFVILRWYAPEASIREFLAMRPTAKALYPLALALGVALSPPLNYAYGRLLDRFPIDDPGGIAEAWAQANGGRRVLLVLLIAVVGPLVEEIVFRGALFLPVRRYAEAGHPLSVGPIFESLRRVASESGPELARNTVKRASAGIDAVMVTTGLFVLVHLRWQQFVAIIPAALLMGALRQRSGSLWPSFLLHVGFNATPFVGDLIAPEATTVPISWAVGGAAIALPLIAAVVVVARGPEATAAREAELS